MQCDDVAQLLPEAVESGAAVELSVQRHIESCLRCQAELARYRKMLRGLQLLPHPLPRARARPARADPGRHRGGRRAPRRPLDPLGPPPGLRRRHRRRGGRGRHRGHGHDRAPLAPAGRPGHLARPADGGSPSAAGTLTAILSGPARPRPEGSSSIGRAPVSKTGGWGFESLLPCSERRLDHEHPEDGDAVSMNRQTKRMMAKQGTDKPSAPMATSGGRRQRLRPARRSARASTSVRSRASCARSPGPPGRKSSTRRSSC